MPGEDVAALESVSKRFGGVLALDGVSLRLRRGEVHGLLGENGAGKSTLGRVLAGIVVPDAGRLLIDGRAVHFRSPRDALRAGIGMVHQELAFCPDLSVAENLCLPALPRWVGVFTDRRRTRERAKSMLGAIGVSIDVTRPMRELSTGQEQLVQIAAAVATEARVIVFDEPTSSLADSESERLFQLIDRLKAHGTTIVYVSHRMPELFRLCDRMTVLRDGRVAGTLDRAAADPDAVVRLMVGRSVERREPRYLARAPGRVMLELDDVGVPPLVSGVSLAVRAGEIYGLAGLVGAGRSELARGVFGLEPRSGRVRVDGRAIAAGAPWRAIAAGMAMVPEDRKRQGLALELSGSANVSMAMLDRLARLGLLPRRAERAVAEREYARLAVRAPSVETPVASLSGGNQQKVALAKWLARNPAVLIADEPTRGVDVAAKAAIHSILDDLAARGAAILLISSELPELLLLARRVGVMRNGRLVGELSRADATEEVILRLMAGMSASPARHSG